MLTFVYCVSNNERMCIEAFPMTEPLIENAERMYFTVHLRPLEWSSCHRHYYCRCYQVCDSKYDPTHNFLRRSRRSKIPPSPFKKEVSKI